MIDPRLEKLAKVLVGYSTAVKKGDTVVIKGNTVAEPALVAVYREVVKAGAHPWIRLIPDSCSFELLKEGNSDQLSHVSKIEKYITANADVFIGVAGTENTRALTNADPSKQAMIGKARKPIMDLFMKRASGPRSAPGRLRWTTTNYPSNGLAQEAEMSRAEYAEFVFTGGKLDAPNPVGEWKKLSTAQQRLCDFLAKGEVMRITAPNGTDITFGIKDRKWINCDGHENFPDGEVFTGPVETATEGTVVFQFPAIAAGREVDGIRLTFKNGKVVDASANKNEQYLIKMIEQDKGSHYVGELALGTNYNIQRFTRNTLFDEKIGGTFHMALGAAYFPTGSKNQSALHWDLVCDLRKGGRVEIDGKVISRGGKFQRATWPR